MAEIEVITLLIGAITPCMKHYETGRGLITKISPENGPHYNFQIILCDLHGLTSHRGIDVHHFTHQGSSEASVSWN